jgi:hypothetical protein
VASIQIQMMKAAVKLLRKQNGEKWNFTTTFNKLPERISDDSWVK